MSLTNDVKYLKAFEDQQIVVNVLISAANIHSLLGLAVPRLTQIRLVPM